MVLWILYIVLSILNTNTDPTGSDAATPVEANAAKPTTGK